MAGIPDNLKKRVTEDTIEIDGRTFRLVAFDPLLGNYILLKLLTMVLPFGIGKMLQQNIGAGSEMIPTDSTQTEQMSKAEFLDLQRDILKHCFEQLPGDTVPVVRENGTYGISNFTMTIALNLLAAEIAFNFKDFFTDDQSQEETT